ncbi:MAG TPA: lamin tail domain-containing protein [Prolixibacteraceae bacterium]|nr:lamin tail domain-containing protein [Prolixibacteraceae bacterium]HPT30235.1 lamin tail domain-containing protein [Prolixibacteraceae bacterium]
MKLRYIAISIFALLTAFSSCVEDEIYNGPASIEKVTMEPAAPQSSDKVTITAKVLDLKGVSSVNVLFRTSASGTFSSVALTAGQDFNYTGQIPAQAKDAKVEYYVEVKNSGGFSTVYPSGAPAKLASYTVGASTLIKLYINEAFADGTKDATDPDWVEIYNDSEIAVDLSGYAFYDDGIRTSAGAKPKRILNNGTVIQPKGFLVLKTEYTSGEYTVEFGLSTSGDGAYLDNKEGVMVASLDFTTINLAGKKSYGRKPDGSNTLVVFTTPTKGSSNNNAQ